MGTLYAGVNGKAQKVNKLYVGVNGKARRVKKLYVGVNGKARKVFGGPGLYTSLQMNQLRGFSAATSIGNYAIIAGGGDAPHIQPAPLNTIETYNTSLTNTLLSTTLPEAVFALAGASNNSLAIFAGGDKITNLRETFSVNNVIAFNTSLTKSNLTSLSIPAAGFAGAKVGNYVVFLGGYGKDSSRRKGTRITTAYNTTGTRTTLSPLSDSDVFFNSASSIGDYCLFAGGTEKTDNLNITYIGTGSTFVVAYNSSLTASQPTQLVANRFLLASASTSTHAMFVGGCGGSKATRETTDRVEAYDSSLTHSNATALSVSRRALCGITMEGLAIFLGGENIVKVSSSSYTITQQTVVDAYDESLTQTNLDPLSVGKSYSSATTVGDYGLIVGGKGSDYVVDVYTV